MSNDYPVKLSGYVILIKVVAGLSLAVRCRFMNRQKSRYTFDRPSLAEQYFGRSRHMHIFSLWYCVYSYFLFFFLVQLSLISHPPSIRYSWVRADFMFLQLDYAVLHRNKTKTTVQKSVTHFGRIFWHRNWKRALQ